MPYSRKGRKVRFVKEHEYDKTHIQPPNYDSHNRGQNKREDSSVGKRDRDQNH